MKKLFPLLCLIAGFSQSVSAADISTINLLSPAQFKLLSEDFGSALSYKPVSPTENQGITGFDIGLEVTSTDISRSSAALSAASGGSKTISNLIIPKLHAHKGLPFGIDVGAFVSSIPSTNIKLAGGELRVALLRGGIAVPAIGLRAAMTKLSGVNNFAFDTKSVDLSISKGFLMFTPYAGVGRVWSSSTTTLLGATQYDESISQSKVFAGANLNFGLMNFALEGDKTGEASSYSLKFGFRW